MSKEEQDIIIAANYVAFAEFVQATKVHPVRLGELVEMGWLETRRAEDQSWDFRETDIYRTRKLERICADFELPSLGGMIIVDLLDRINSLEQTVKMLRTIAYKG